MNDFKNFGHVILEKLGKNNVWGHLCFFFFFLRFLGFWLNCYDISLRRLNFKFHTLQHFWRNHHNSLGTDSAKHLFLYIYITHITVLMTYGIKLITTVAYKEINLVTITSIINKRLSVKQLPNTNCFAHGTRDIMNWNICLYTHEVTISTNIGVL